MKQRVFIFSDNKCIELVNPLNIDQYKTMPNALINPNLSLLKHVPRHYWKKDGDKVVEMTAEEKAARNVAMVEAHKPVSNIESNLLKVWTKTNLEVEQRMNKIFYICCAILLVALYGALK